MSDIQIEGLDRLLTKLDRISSLRVLAPPMAQSLSRLNSFMDDYPPERKRSQPFKSDKQRRFFFAALRDGRIVVPYHRTGLLGRTWQMRVQITAQQVIGVLSNDTPYGPFVQAPPPTQAAYHQGNWRTTDDAVQKLGPVIVQTFKRAIEEALR